MPPGLRNERSKIASTGVAHPLPLCWHAAYASWWSLKHNRAQCVRLPQCWPLLGSGSSTRNIGRAAKHIPAELNYLATSIDCRR